MKKETKPDVVELINKMREVIDNIDRKIDILIGKSSARPVEAKPFHKPFQQQPRVHGHNEVRQDNSFRERVLHKAICADCKKGCEVPFKPSGERPVYCKDCFSKRKSGGPFKARPDIRPRVTPPAQTARINHPETVEKTVEKKKPVAKKKQTSKNKKK